MEDLTDQLNKSKDISRRFEHVKDNEKSILKDILNDAIDALGGYHADVFGIEDVGERLVSIHSTLGDHNLNLETAQKQCVKVEKIEELVVNENSSVRDLNIAVLMTHWDYIAPVYFLRYTNKVLRKVCSLKLCFYQGKCTDGCKTLDKCNK